MLRVERLCGHSVVVDWLDASSVVVDLGASRGIFAQAVIERFGCKVVSLEPVASLFASLPSHALLRTERLAVTAGPDSVTVFVGDSDEDATIEERLHPEGRPTERVGGITLAGVLARFDLAQPALVKMDIEGTELDVLDSVEPETLARIEQLSVEYHDFLQPAWRPRVLSSDRRLRALGFHRLRVSRDHSDVLYVNGAIHPLGRVARLALLVRYRFVWGFARTASRRLAKLRS
jgi:FkbM family methyltransferase